jgi:hypothetical protein
VGQLVISNVDVLFDFFINYWFWVFQKTNSKELEGFLAVI